MSESDDTPALHSRDAVDGDAGGDPPTDRSSVPSPGQSRVPGPVSRRVLLGAGVASLAALAGCGGGGDDGDGGDGTGDPTTTMPTADPQMVSSWSGSPYRETENGSLVMAVDVENPDDTPREGTLRLHFEYNGTEYEQTRAVSFDGEETREYELAFPEMNRSDVTSGVRIHKNLTESE